METTDLRGKNYFTQKEGAHYAGISLNKFRDWSREVGLIPTRPHGKLLYRKKDIDRVLESEWQRLEKMVRHGT